MATIDTDEGAKIVKNVFGDKTDDVAVALGSAHGAQGSGIEDLLGWLLGGGKR